MSPTEFSESSINHEAAEQADFHGIKLSLIMKETDLKETHRSKEVLSCEEQLA